MSYIVNYQTFDSIYPPNILAQTPPRTVLIRDQTL